MKKFPKRHIFAATAMVLCSLALVFALGRQYTGPICEDDIMPAASPVSPVSTVHSAARGEYEVKLWENTVCVFLKDGSLLIKTDINPSKLRLADKNELTDGIRVQSIEQVRQLLEDFGS